MDEKQREQVLCYLDNLQEWTDKAVEGLTLVSAKASVLRDACISERIRVAIVAAQHLQQAVLSVRNAMREVEKLPF